MWHARRGGIIFIVWVLIFSNALYSQCCSSGNPVSGTTNIGVLDKHAFRLITYYQHSYSDGYYTGSKKSDFSFVKDAKFDYAGLVLSYGLFNRITLETELGYFIGKSQTYNLSPLYTNTGYGLNNGVVSLKYNLLSKKEIPLEWTISAGAKFPFAKTYQLVNNVQLPRDVQPSTNAFGVVLQSFFYKGFAEKKIKLFLINRFETNFSDYTQYKVGNFLMSSVFFTKTIGNSNFTVIISARNEYRGKDITNAVFCCNGTPTGSLVNASGGSIFFIAPQLNYTMAKKWNLSIVTDFPVYGYYNGTQLGNKFSYSVYLVRSFAKKCETIPVSK